MKRVVDVLDLSEETRDLVRESEARGSQTLFERNGRPVAILVSYDEYLALGGRRGEDARRWAEGIRVVYR